MKAASRKLHWLGAKSNTVDDRQSPGCVALTSEQFVWSIGSLCQLHRIPFDAKLLIGHFAGPYSMLSLVGAAREVGLKCDLRNESARGCDRWAVPCIALLSQATQAATSDASADAIGSTACIALVLKVDSERILMFSPGQSAPTVVSRAEFAEQFAGTVFFAAPAGKSVKDDDTGVARAKFGFRWFFDELLKHRDIWRDVLLASLAIQLMALATPLFTQVVIDKVVVHHTVNTLIAVGMALAVFMIFSAAMSWVRQYLI